MNEANRDGKMAASKTTRFILALTPENSTLPERYPEEWEGISCVVLYVYDNRWTNLCIPRSIATVTAR